MAYNIDAFKTAGYEKKYMQEWAGKTFGKEKDSSIAKVLNEYYQLAFERKPEFMGWSQTEPETQINYTGFNHFSYGDEAQQRIDRYDALEQEVKTLRKGMDKKEEPAFYQLVYYPVVSAGWMNKKFLYRDKAYLYGKQNRISAYQYAALSQAVYDSIVRETACYNVQLNGGKWKNIMNIEPRKLPVYLPPVLPKINIEKGDGWDAVSEGYDTVAYQNKLEKKLPAFIAGLHQSYFIDVFLTGPAVAEWQAKASEAWIKIFMQKGTLLFGQQQTDSRCWVSVDWPKVPVGTQAAGIINILANGKKVPIHVTAMRPVAPDFAGYKGFAEQNGLVSIFAGHYTNKEDETESKWQAVPGLGYTGAAMQSYVKGDPDTATIQQLSTRLTYTFYSFSDAAPTLSVFTLPTHPLNTGFSMRYAIRIDDSKLKIMDFKTYGRSEEWKQNVLRNAAIREIELPPLKPGKHIVTIYAIDPGVILDRMLIRFGDVPKCYSVVPETTKN